MARRRGDDPAGGGHEKAQTTREDRDLHRGAGFMRLAVGVDEAGGGAVDDEARAPVPLHSWTAVEGAGKQPHHERQRAPQSGRPHGHEVKETVVDAGAGRQPGMVAILIGVGDGD